MPMPSGRVRVESLIAWAISLSLRHSITECGFTSEISPCCPFARQRQLLLRTRSTPIKSKSTPAISARRDGSIQLAFSTVFAWSMVVHLRFLMSVIAVRCFAGVRKPWSRYVSGGIPGWEAGPPGEMRAREIEPPARDIRSRAGQTTGDPAHVRWSCGIAADARYSGIPHTSRGEPTVCLFRPSRREATADPIRQRPPPAAWKAPGSYKTYPHATRCWARTRAWRSPECD